MNRPRLAHAGQLLTVAAVYACLGKLGLTLAPVSGFATLIWPPTGLSLAVLLIGGYRFWPAVWAGALVTNLWTGAPCLVAFGIAAGNTLEAVTAARMLRSIPGFRGSLDRFTDVVGLATAGMVGAALSATLGVVSLRLGGLLAPGALAWTWATWWTGNVMGALVVAPVLLAWARWPRVVPLRRAALVEGAVIVIALIALATVVFSLRHEVAAEVPILQPYVLFLPLIWAALRFGTPGAALGVLVVAVPAVLGTHAGNGAFSRADEASSLTALHVFLGSAWAAALSLGAVVSERDRDARERRQIEDHLRRSEERMRLAVLAADLGAWCWDAKGGELEWSPQCKRLHGLRADEEITYARFLSLLHADDRDVTEQAVARSLEERSDYRIEHRVVRPDGSERWLSVLGRPFFDEEGQLDRMLGVTMDVTSLKEAEQKRAELRARERAALAEAQAATRAKDEFLAVLSHELRTPLQAMLGWTQVLQQPRVDAGRLRKGLASIERNVRAQGRIIEDLLDVSRIVAGKLRLSKHRVELADVIRPALEQAKADGRARSIRVDADVEPLGDAVYGDPDRLQQVVSNLLTNAVKFTPSGGHVAVRLERAGSAARFVVEDTGCGISPEFLPHMFDRFRQAEGTISRSHGGLGLGLAIARHLVEQHGGTITAESEGKDRGSTFTVTLPLLGADRPVEAGDRPKGRHVAARAPGELDGVRILVVDDDADACELLETVLREAGAHVHAVGSARAALSALESFRPHLLVSDIGMPGEDGYALLRHVRARESAASEHLPAIALTAFASAADREQAFAAGFEAHLAKPVSLGDLASAVARLVYARRAS